MAASGSDERPDMDFIVAANNGTHIYRAAGLTKPALLRSLPPAQIGNAHCLSSSSRGGTVAVLLQNGYVGVWDLLGPAFNGGSKSSRDGPPPVACEIAPQAAGPIQRCCFSPKGTFLVAWEPLTGASVQRLPRPPPQDVAGGAAPAKGSGKTGGAYPQPPGGGGGGATGGGIGIALTRAENLTVWAINRRTGAAGGEFEVEVTKDGTHKLGVNVDHGDGKNGLLIRKVNPGLVEEHNKQALERDVGKLVLPLDRVIAVNSVSSAEGALAQAMAEEIQNATRLVLRIRRGPGWAWPTATARFFLPQLLQNRWPVLAWSSDEARAFRSVTGEIQVLDGRSLQLIRRLRIDNVSQLSVSPTPAAAAGEDSAAAIACFSPPGTTASPAMVRVFTEYGKAAKPALTKSFFSDAAWVTFKWEPTGGVDLLLLVHSLELTEADYEGRTLHGQGGNGLYLLRAGEAMEPIVALSGSQEGGVIIDVQWCPRLRGEYRSLVMLQGPQPALVTVFSYKRGGGVPQKLQLGRFGVRNALRWDPHGCTFCLRVHSNRGAGVSSEADSIDIFEAEADGPGVARRGGAAVGGKRDREQAISPSIIAVDFSPCGEVLLCAVEAHYGSELKFVNVADGSALYRLKFDDVYAAFWQPALEGQFAAPVFPEPPSEARLGALAGGAILEVEVRDREGLRRRVRGLRDRLKDIERLKAKVPDVLDAQQHAKVASEHDLRASLAQLEVELEAAEALDKSTIVFEVQTALGAHVLEVKAGECCRDVARRFCKERRLDAQVAGALAERMEQRLQRPVVGSGPSTFEAQSGAPLQPDVVQTKRQGPKPKSIDLGDKEAVKRRVRTLQKKLREIEKLRLIPERSLDPLQREKLFSEEEIRRDYAMLARELDLLERVPRMVFDVETDQGVRYIEYREGDNCAQLAYDFCRHYGLDEELVEPLAQHMEDKLRDQAILHE
eukprot:TRINITY_DN28533_c0_g1_i1.p1 TRINITY_DN28533_c0_g1~~TRINITY_DN28533_c0_g1_i1.p1  ORF type:complete len:951 (-),score=223.74 TRINITY_DN28533_c0_g1_i1:89-2941(-)